MEKEKVKTHSALERLQNCFVWSTPKDAYRPKKALLELNDEEDIKAQLYSLYSSKKEFTRKMIKCQVRRNEKSIVDFSIGEKGLESMGFSGLEFSFRGSPGIKINDEIGIGYLRDLNKLHVDEVEWEKFQGIANNIADWVENMKSAGGIGDVPLNFTVNI